MGVHEIQQQITLIQEKNLQAITKKKLDPIDLSPGEGKHILNGIFKNPTYGRQRIS